MIKMEEVTITIACPVGDGHELAKNLMSSVVADTATVYKWNHGIRQRSEQAVKEIIKVATTEALGSLMFVIHNKVYELRESDVDGHLFGYDIYEDDSDDPINLGDIAYFDHEPTQIDVVRWIEDFEPIV